MTLANFLTLIRILLAPVVFYVILAGQDLMVLALLILATLTDVGDGWVARATGRVSRLGIVLDPVADKLVIGATLLAGGLAGRLPLWLVWAYLGKEILQLAGGAIFLARRPTAPIMANRFGKAATTVTFCGFFLLWLGYHPGWWLVLAGLILGLVAAGTYLHAGLKP